MNELSGMFNREVHVESRLGTFACWCKRRGSKDGKPCEFFLRWVLIKQSLSLGGVQVLQQVSYMYTSPRNV